MNEHCNLQDKRESGPLVSVVVDTYNHEAFIGQAIASVLQQEYQLGAVEVLVVDDGSQDGTAKQLAAFTNPPENTGSPSPWFGGLKLAAWSGDDRGEEKGKLVAVQGKNVIRKNRGRRATGHDGLTTIRLSSDLRESVDAWAAIRGSHPASQSWSVLLREIHLRFRHFLYRTQREVDRNSCGGGPGTMSEDQRN